MSAVEGADGAEGKTAGRAERPPCLNYSIFWHVPKTGKELKQWRPSLRYL